MYCEAEETLKLYSLQSMLICALKYRNVNITQYRLKFVQEGNKVRNFVFVTDGSTRWR